MKIVEVLSVNSALTYVILGILAATIVALLDNRKVRGGILSTEIAGVIGSYFGWFFSILVFGVQYFEPNVSSLMLSFTMSMLVVILWRVASRETLIDNTPSFRRHSSNRYIYVTHHQIARKNTKQEAREFVKTVAFPVSKRDLVHFAEAQDVNRETLSLFESLPDHIYRNAKELHVQLKHAQNELVVP